METWITQLHTKIILHILLIIIVGRASIISYFYLLIMTIIALYHKLKLQAKQYILSEK